jgi:hypothetical protein
MSKKIALVGPFKDAAGKEHETLVVEHGRVFFNADDPNTVTVIVVEGEEDKKTEAVYTAEHHEVLNGGLLSAGASYRHLGITG